MQSFAKIRSGLTAFFGEKDSAISQDPDAFFQFKNTLQHFIEMLKTGKPDFDWHETVEMAKIVIAGQLSLEKKGQVIRLEEV